MYPASRATSVSVSRPTSGTPAVAFAIPAPLTYTASNPTRSTCRAMAAFGTPGSMTAPFAMSARSCAAFVCFVMSSEPLSFRAKLRNLSLFLIRHLQRLHQLIDVFGFIQFRNKLDNLFRSAFPNDALDKSEELSFDCRIFEPILRVAQRIIDASG